MNRVLVYLEIKLQLRTILGGILLVSALTVNLASTPAPWWDEGWTMSVARNWVVLRHYGRLLDGQPTARGLEAAFPVTAAVALGFRLFGIGIIQARIVSVIFTLVALALLYELARSFYNHSIALATLLIAIFMSGAVEINPLIAGRQVLAEIPAMCFLLAGYLCFILADKYLTLFMPAAICFWSVALFTKIQVLPFWIASLSLPSGLMLFRKQWRSARMFGIGLIGTMALYFFLQHAFARILPSSAVSGLTRAIALAWVTQTRLFVLTDISHYGIPTLLALSWALLKCKNGLLRHTELVRFSVLIFVGSWIVWYITLSLAWVRYIFPAVFCGSVFVAAMLDDWTNHFNFAWTIERAGTALRKLQFRAKNLIALAAIILVAMSVGQTITMLYGAYIVDADSSIDDTLHFLNTATPPNALIETYEAELYFLLNRRYHYPPDQVHVDLIRRNSFGEPVKIDYNPLKANADYLVVGPQSKFWDFYDPYLKAGAFRSLKNFKRYEVLERVR
jgi:hypothetical protein